MKQNEVATGHVYLAKVSDKVVPVRIESEHPRQGWLATSLVTHKRIHVKSAQRLRCEWGLDGNAPAPPDAQAKPAEARHQAIGQHSKGSIVNSSRNWPMSIAQRSKKRSPGGLTLLWFCDSMIARLPVRTSRRRCSIAMDSTKLR